MACGAARLPTLWTGSSGRTEAEWAASSVGRQPPRVCRIQRGTCNVFCAASSLWGAVRRRGRSVEGDHSCPARGLACRECSLRLPLFCRVHGANACGDAGALTRSPWPILGCSSPCAAAALSGGSPFRASLLEPEFLHPASSGFSSGFPPRRHRHGGHSPSGRKSVLCERLALNVGFDSIISS